MNNDTGGCAYPSMDYIHKDENDSNHYRVHGDNGMTLRDHFAGLAMQGLLSGALADGSSLGEECLELFSTKAYEFADAMIVQRGK